MPKLAMYGLTWDVGPAQAQGEEVENGRLIPATEWSSYDGSEWYSDDDDYRERQLEAGLRGLPERPEPEDREVERELLGRRREKAYGSHLGRSRRTLYRGFRGAFKKVQVRPRGK